MSRPIPIYHENVQEFPEETWIPPKGLLSLIFPVIGRGRRETYCLQNSLLSVGKENLNHRSKFARSNRLESNWNSNSTNFEVETNIKHPNNNWKTIDKAVVNLINNLKTRNFNLQFLKFQAGRASKHPFCPDIPISQEFSTTFFLLQASSPLARSKPKHDIHVRTKPDIARGWINDLSLDRSGIEIAPAGEKLARSTNLTVGRRLLPG